MPRPSQIKAGDYESRITTAIDKIKYGDFKSVNEVATQLGISKTTLGRRLKGHLSRAEARADQKNLTKIEEKVLLRHIRQLTKGGYPLSYETLKLIAFYVRSRRLEITESKSPISSVTPRFGHNWAYRFVKRHPDLKSVTARRIDIKRMQGASKNRQDFL